MAAHPRRPGTQHKNLQKAAAALGPRSGGQFLLFLCRQQGLALAPAESAALCQGRMKFVKAGAMTSPTNLRRAAGLAG